MKIMTVKSARALAAIGICLYGFLYCSTQGWAQTEPVGRSYEERQRVFKPGGGTKDVDPNVYVYTPEFAKRFQMPMEWTSSELTGVDAVAFRVMPNYASCGWGGNPKACRTDEVRCVMDLYFDHKRNPLPWDERYPEVLADGYQSSSRFIPAYGRESRLPKHPNDLGFSDYSPFVDQKTGKGLSWQYFSSLDKRSGSGFRSFRGYDKEIFSGVSLVTISADCGGRVAVLALASGALDTPFNSADKKVIRSILLPQSWQIRVQVSQRESNERSSAFFKSEGEKAIKALRDSPVPSQSIVPMQ